MNTQSKLDIRHIGERISVAESKSEDGSKIWSLVILPSSDKWKLLGLFGWIIAWTVCGFLIIGSYKLAIKEEQKIFIIVFSIFWLYYEWKMISVFIWRKWGKEKLWYKDGMFILEEKTKGKSKIKSFRADDINSIEIEEFNEKSFFDFMSNSFWSKGKPRIKINVLGKNIYFAYQISDAEAKNILREMNKQISRKS